MQLTIAASDLAALIAAPAALASSSASTIPATGNVKFTAAADGTVTVEGTDGAAIAVSKARGNVDKPGVTTIPADTLVKAIKTIPAKAEVSIVATSARVNVSASGSKFSLATLPVDDFPEFRRNDPTISFIMPAKALKECIERTSYALPAKDHRRVLLGIHCVPTGASISFEATDGKKLVRTFAAIAECAGSSDGFVVPRETMDLLFRTLTVEGPVRITAGNGQVAFSIGSTEIVANQIEGKYPDLNAVIPKNPGTVIPINRDEFMSLAKRAGILADEKNKSISLAFGAGECSFESKAHGEGAFTGTIPVDFQSEFRCAFNFQFLAETLSRLPSSVVRMVAKSENAPILFQTDLDVDGQVVMLMPIKVADVAAAEVEEGTNHG
jgi:DNA polymerase-3 subunit beta